MLKLSKAKGCFLEGSAPLLTSGKGKALLVVQLFPEGNTKKRFELGWGIIRGEILLICELPAEKAKSLAFSLFSSNL